MFVDSYQTPSGCPHGVGSHWTIIMKEQLDILILCSHPLRFLELGVVAENTHIVFRGSSAKLLEKAMANHSSILAWRIPGTEEPGGLQSMGLHRVRHDWSDLAAAAAAKLPEVRPMTKGFATELAHMWIHVHRWFLSGPGNAMPEGTSILITASYLVSVNLVSLNADTMATLPPTFLMCGMWKEQRVMLGEKVYWGPSWFSLWCWAPSCRLREEPWLKHFPQSWHSQGCSLVCVLLGLLRFAYWLKAFPHRWHL